jgi:hypothetical protein
VLGAWFAVTETDRLPRFRDTWLGISAMTYVLFAALIMWARDWPLAGLAPQFLVAPFTPKALEELTPYRIAHLIALLYLFTCPLPVSGASRIFGCCVLPCYAARNGFPSSAPACFFP